MRRPAESPGGLANTEPAFAPPGWCSRRQRTISAMLGLAGGRRRRRPTRKVGADHDLGGPIAERR